MGRYDPAFNITGIPPEYLDFNWEYPVLAVRIKFFSAGILGGRGICAKRPYFLTVDKENRFQWVSQDESFLCRPETKNLSDEHIRKTKTKYSVFNEEQAKMIYPIRQFSITGIEMEGFDSRGEYPVLAMETERVLQEASEEEGEETGGAEPRKEVSMAFFLVGDDNGEFAWIAEDECRLYPLNQ